MGKGGRILCIFTPYALTIASLVCIIMVGLGCTNKDSSSLNNLYFFRANLKDLTTSSSAESAAKNLLNSVGKDVPDDKLSEALNEAQKELNIKDFYTIGLWGYCDGSVTNSDYDVDYCSPAKAEFWFNPVEVWKLNGTGVENAMPNDMQKALKIYQDVSKWMFIAYIVAFAATVAELVIGIFAICSRWGSCVTSLISGVAFLFTTAASVTATALFVTLTGTFNTALKQYNIKGSMGHNIYVATWLAVAFSLAASLFWVISSCCCSGRSPYNDRNRHKGVTAEKAPYTYEPLGLDGTRAPYAHQNTAYQSHPQHAYEPFRHV